MLKCLMVCRNSVVLNKIGSGSEAWASCFAWRTLSVDCLLGCRQVETGPTRKEGPTSTAHEFWAVDSAGFHSRTPEDKPPQVFPANPLSSSGFLQYRRVEPAKQEDGHGVFPTANLDILVSAGSRIKISRLSKKAAVTSLPQAPP